MRPLDSNLIALVRQQAVSAGVDPALACAIVEQESAWNVWAIRYEPDFYQRYEAAQKLTPTEKTARALSWGLFQTMGQVVREAGFKGDLASLCDPTISVQWGLTVWKKKLQIAGGDVTKGLLFWNGGSNANYPAEVLARVPKYQA